MVPPYKGCGWQTSAAWVASGWPWFNRASSRPAGPLRKKDLMAVATLFYITACSRQHSAIGQGRIATFEREKIYTEIQGIKSEDSARIRPLWRNLTRQIQV